MAHVRSSRYRQSKQVGEFRRLLLWLALAYLAFVIYGSLVPLEFRFMPMNEAIAAFRNIPFLNLGLGSRADWVANLLLFIPLAFIWTALLVLGRGAPIRVLASVFVAGACVALSLGIEFTQLFFPQRTVSQNDIMAESVGGLLGIVAWWSFGSKALAWYEGWHLSRAPADLAERLAWAYLVGIYAYNLLPLDLTLSAVELFHKWREGKLHLIPFSALPAEPVEAIYELASDAALWAVLAVLWALKGAASRFSPWQMTLFSALLLEVMQLFVYSRVSDVTDLITAAVGGALGAWAAARHGAQTGTVRRPVQSTWLAIVLALGWLGVLVGVFWYPFNFDVNGLPLGERLDFLGRAPFVTYYFGSEFRAATEVLHKMLFFIPLGGLLAWWVGLVSWKWRDAAFITAFLAIPVAALMIELGQVFLPGKVPDSTDAFLESSGGWLGYAFVRWARRRSKRRPVRSVPSHDSEMGHGKTHV